MKDLIFLDKARRDLIIMKIILKTRMGLNIILEAKLRESDEGKIFDS